MASFNTRTGTVWVIFAVAAILLGWEFYVLYFPTVDGSTISEVLLTWARKHPIVPFLWGVLMGHLHWPQEVPADPGNRLEAKVS